MYCADASTEKPGERPYGIAKHRPQLKSNVLSLRWVPNTNCPSTTRREVARDSRQSREGPTRGHVGIAGARNGAILVHEAENDERRDRSNSGSRAEAVRSASSGRRWACDEVHRRLAQGGSDSSGRFGDFRIPWSTSISDDQQSVADAADAHRQADFASDPRRFSESRGEVPHARDRIRPQRRGSACPGVCRLAYPLPAIVGRQSPEPEAQAKPNGLKSLGAVEPFEDSTAFFRCWVAVGDIMERTSHLSFFGDHPWPSSSDSPSSHRSSS